MKTLHIQQPRDVVALLVRRKWWILAPFIALSSAVILLTSILPRTYVSTSLIVIRPRDVPKEFVKDLIAGTTEERLKGIEQTVLSRTNLLEVLRQFDDEMTEYRPLNLEQRVVKLRSRIEVVFDGQKSSIVGDGVAFFRVSFQSQNAGLAQKVTSKLTSLFIEHDKSARQIQVAGTTEFLATEVEKAEAALSLSDTKLRQLKESERYHLPDQIETNMKQLERLSLDLRANRDALDRIASQRMSLQQLIVATPPTNVNVRQSPVVAAGPRRVPNPKVEEYRRKKSQYDELSARYTEKHPDVASLKLQLDQLKAEIPVRDFDIVADEPNEPTVLTETSPNPAYENLTAQLLQVDTEIRIREQGTKELESQIASYNQRVEATATTEQRLKDVLRENEDLNRQYQELKNKLFDAKQSQTLESGQQGSQFDIIDPANYPLGPVKPLRSVIVLVGMAISGLIGIALALVVDLLNQKVWTQSEIEALLGVPVLAEIPPIITAQDLVLARKKRIALAVSAFAAVSGYGSALYIAYIHQASVLKGLDPLIQKLVY